MEQTILQCNVPGCGGPASGICINGLSFEECPDVTSAKQGEAPLFDTNEKGTTDALTPVFHAMTPTNGAGSLDAISCDILLRARGGILVAIVAGPETGKTTLIATIYELIFRRRIANIKFAGSETLRGYEERCYLARLASNNNIPDTPRTRTAAKLSFTHLRLFTSENGIKDIIFSDRSGEHFENVLSTPRGIMNFAEIARADIVLFLVDLKELLRSPHLPISQIRRLFIIMEKSGLLSGKKIRVVGTKADLMESAERKAEAQQALSTLTSDLLRRSDTPLDIKPLLISARRCIGVSEAGEGIDVLMKDILEPKPPGTFTHGTTWPTRPTELDRLMSSYRNREE